MAIDSCQDLRQRHVVPLWEIELKRFPRLLLLLRRRDPKPPLGRDPEMWVGVRRDAPVRDEILGMQCLVELI